MSTLDRAAEIIARHKAGPWWASYHPDTRKAAILAARLTATEVLALRDAHTTEAES